jgi:hypothetical protein
MNAKEKGVMQRTLVLTVLVVGAAAALVVGSVSVLAGAGPVTDVASAVVGADDPDDGDLVEDDDADGDEVDGNGAEEDAAKGANDIAQVIADAFGSSQEDVMAMHDEGVGFGAMFKLHALAAAMEMSVDELLATIPTNSDGGYEFGFGELRKALTEEQQAVYESGPKNLGQLKKASKEAGADGGGDVTATGLEEPGKKLVAKVSNGHGPPDHAKAHGRN